VRVVSWRQEDLDAGIDGRTPPQTEPVEARVVGVVRFLEDVQPVEAGNAAGTVLPSYLFLPPGWHAAHPEPLASYGASSFVRLRGGPAAIAAFREAGEGGLEGWAGAVFPVGDADIDAARRVVDTERRAVLVFAAIAAIATLAFVGLTASRQLRREFSDHRVLAALGFTRTDVLAAAAMRALVIALPAAVLAVAVTIAISPLGPLGLARHLEYERKVRVDLPVLVLLVVAIAVSAVALSAFVTTRLTRARRAPVRRRVSRFGTAAGVSAVPSAGASFVRSSSSRAAIAVAAAAASALVAANCLVVSLDRVIDEPERYGAWWDVAVGQYSEASAFEHGVSLIGEIDSVRTAAGFYDEVAFVDGQEVAVNVALDIVGRHEPVVTTGRAPVRIDELAMGKETADRLDKEVGDTVELAMDVPGDERVTMTFTVVGIATMSNPINDQRSAGQGVYVSSVFFESLEIPFPPQSIAIEFDPDADRAAAMRAVTERFSGSMRLAEPQADVTNLARLRSVPWLVAALVAILALTTVVHALVVIVHRHRRDLAVLAALGLTRRQQRAATTVAGGLIVGAGLVMGVPVGLLLGRVVWRALADEIDIPSGPAHTWSVSALVLGLGLLVGYAVTTLVSRRALRMPTAEALRVE
jgi:ABC-type antimicrobial peptide transport system permease subunit